MNLSRQKQVNQSQYNHKKYRAFEPLGKTDRRWPDQQITQAPEWCSVDLRDGNQALIEPMTPEQKLQMFELLVDVGFKQIEVGFPAASQTDFDFVRLLIEEQRIPDDVTIQVLTQARESLIKRSFEAMKGARRVIMHVYNSTSGIQRARVFKKSRAEIRAIAVAGARMVKQYAEKQPETEWQFEYSPESFSQTEMDYAIEVCNAVIDVWQPTPENKVILNIPATVEASTPNIYADQVEYFNDHIARREAICISLHTHNDRGSAIAAAELGLLAGAERLEGTLLGNGERTGNMDIVTAALNLYSQGIDPKLNLSQMDRIINVVERCTQIAVHPRHPYAGELVFAAFSGSHQDAINKCLAIDRHNRQQHGEDYPWEVAYLPIDPRDLGRSYQEVIRINSQSGKGGMAYVLEQDYGLHLPRWLQVDFSPHVQQVADTSKKELSAETLYTIFRQTYLDVENPYAIKNYAASRSNGTDKLTVELLRDNHCIKLKGSGCGILDAFIAALNAYSDSNIIIIDYNEHTLGSSEQSQAICYVQLSINAQRYCAAGKSNDIVGASLHAVLNALAKAGLQIMQEPFRVSAQAG